MSARLLIVDPLRVVRAKSAEALSVGIVAGPHNHGRVGWFKADRESDWIELRYWGRSGHEPGWIAVGEYQERTETIRANNIAFFQSRPEKLREKIRLKQGRNRLRDDRYGFFVDVAG